MNRSFLRILSSVLCLAMLAAVIPAALAATPDALFRLDEVPFAITQQPEDATTASGETVTFSVAVGGDGLSYQWQESGNGSTWTDTGAYASVLGNGLTAGASESFTFQWQYSTDNGTTWVDETSASATSAVLSLDPTRSMNGRSYRCVITNAANDVLTSEAAALNLTDATILQDDVLYAFTEDDNLVVVEYQGSASSVIIPQMVEGAVVTEIGESAFEGNTTLASIDLPDSITVIHKRAFADCSNLSEMN